jgi:hypothetical protein
MQTHEVVRYGAPQTDSVFLRSLAFPRYDRVNVLALGCSTSSPGRIADRRGFTDKHQARRTARANSAVDERTHAPAAYLEIRARHLARNRTW